MISTFELLSKEDCKKLCIELEKFKFTDGKQSANGYAKELKENYQLESTFEGVGYIFDSIKELMMKNRVISRHYMPVAYPRIFANYYAGGHRYDWHVDMAFMNGKRTDFSFTIALKDPESYQGGTLEMKLGDGTIKQFRLPQGHIVLYPTGQLHRVTEVTEGFRLCVVGWMQSAIGDQEDRELHSEMCVLLDSLADKYGLGWEDLNEFNQFRQKLVRRFLK